MKFRYARHTNKLNQLTHFYTEVIGLELLGSFENHDGYDGVFLGLKNKDWHLEFTQSIEQVNHKPDDDDLMVLYPSQEEFDLIHTSLKKHGISLLKAKNPYWNVHGLTIQDPDGFKLVIATPA